MRRSALAVVLVAFVATLATLTPGVAAPTVVQPAAAAYDGDKTGNFSTLPDEFFEGERVRLSANFPTDAALLDVTFLKESAPGSGDYEVIDTDEANAQGNAYLSDYQVDEAQEVFGQTIEGDVTQLHQLEPKVVEPGSCTQTGALHVDPSFITPGQKVKLTANFPSDQAAAGVTFFKKVGTDMEPIGSDDANSYGNAYLSGYAVEDQQDVYALTSKGECTETETLNPTVIQPESFPESGSISTTPTTVFDGRKATVNANFPNGAFDVTLFQETDPGEWTAIGQDESNTSGNAYITGVEFDGDTKLFALTDTGVRTPVRTFEPAAPNDITGGPKNRGHHVVYVTTDSGKTPVTKGVDYEGKAVLTTGAEETETLDVETIAVRGNSSADKAKKPYKLKFEEKQKPFGMKNDKTWILLANYGDWTLIRSMVAWDLGRMLNGLKWTPTSTFAEVFINGKYKGSYQMVESIKIDKNRVNVNAETGQVIEFDPHYRTDGVPGMAGKTGVKYAWKDPDEFKTLDEGGGEDPKGLTAAKIADMKQKIRNFEDVLYGPEGNRNWATYDPSSPAEDWTTYLDMSSAVDYYLAREYTKDNDADMYRSNFFYTNNVDPDSVDPADPADPDKFFLGPIWDFDRSAGAKPEDGSTTITKTSGWWMRGNGSPNHDTNRIHWYTRITDDPRFLNALHTRWAAKKAVFESVATGVPGQQSGVSAAVTKLGGTASYDLGKQVAANDRNLWQSFGSRYPPKTSSYTGEIAWVRNWYQKRYAWMDQELSKAPPPVN